MDHDDSQTVPFASFADAKRALAEADPDDPITYWVVLSRFVATLADLSRRGLLRVDGDDDFGVSDAT